MIDFAQLVFDLETSTKSSSRLHALIQYFSKADGPSKIWAIAILIGRRPKRIVTPNELKAWAQAKIGLPNWLLLDSYASVGDPMETLSILLPKPTTKSSKNLSEWIFTILNPQVNATIKANIFEYWEEQSFEVRFIYNKLITGTFRLTLPESLIVKALSFVSGTNNLLLALRIHLDWNPMELSYEELTEPSRKDEALKLPFPSFKMNTLDSNPNGNIDQWHVVKRYVGIDCQVIIRDGQMYIWHDEINLITNHFPELDELLDVIPDDSILIGQLTSKTYGTAHEIQARLGKKTTSKKQRLSNSVCLVIRDIVKFNGKYLSKKSTVDRWQLVEKWLSQTKSELLFCPEKIQNSSWSNLFKTTDMLENSIPMIGFIITESSSTILDAKTDSQSDLYFWPLPALSTNAVLLYAKSEQGGRASHFSEYTFAVWNDAELIPFVRIKTKGLDPELNFINSFIIQNTVEKFGPARSIDPVLVFEIQFDRVQESKRHKCGLSVINPAIKAWNPDMTLENVADLKDLQKLLPQE